MTLNETQFRLICISLAGTLFQLSVFVIAFNKNASSVKNLYWYIAAYISLTLCTTPIYYKIYGNT